MLLIYRNQPYRFTGHALAMSGPETDSWPRPSTRSDDSVPMRDTARMSSSGDETLYPHPERIQ